MGIQFDTGIDFSEFTGGFPMPEACNGAIKIYDDNNHMRVLVLDYSDGCFYDISLRDGPSSSNVVNGFYDKADTDGTGGVAIEPSVTFKEDTGEYEKFITEHHTSRFYVRPNKETDRNTTGYDNKGYLNNTEFTAELYVDGEPVIESAIAQDITRNNEVVYDRKVEGYRIQTKFTANNSSLKLIGRQQEYITKNIVYDPDNRPTTEQSFQSYFSQDITHWFTRGEITPATCRITGISITGTYDLSTGFDGKPDSSILVANGNTINLPVLNLSSTHRMYFWSSGLLTDVIITGNSGTITLVLVLSSTWFLYYIDISTTDSNYNIDISNNGTDVKIFDIRIFNTLKTFTARYTSYYISDISYNDGNNLLPLV